MVDGYWKDTGRPEDLLEANRMMLGELSRRIDGDVDPESVVDGPVVVEAGAKIVRSRIVGPCVIGAGALVEGSTVGPHVSLSPSCVVVSSTVEDTIAMEGSRIEGVRTLTGSILGRNVDVRHSGSEGVTRLVVGDQSRVEV
jgi:glucose-1-phosphate thymidylyltransferase